MADNITLSAGTGGDTYAADDIGGVKFSRVKLVEGADGTNDGDISSANPLPVETPNRTASGALGALDAAVTISAQETGTVNWEIDTGTLSGTVVFEATLDDTTWFAINAVRIDGTIIANTTTFADRGALTSTGYSQVRLRVSVYTSGTSNARVEASAGSSVVRIGQAVPVTDNAGSLTVDNAALSVTGGGVESGALRVTIANNSTGLLSVNATLQASTNTTEVVGDVAHSVAAAGNPLLVCGVSQDQDDTAPPNRVDAEGDATRIATDRDGAVFVRPFGPQIWSYHENSSSTLTDASVHAAPGANLSLYVTDIVVSTGAATAFNIFFEEAATTVLGPYYLEAVAGRGLAIHFGTPKKITANTALTVTTSAAIAHAIDIQGYVAQG